MPSLSPPLFHGRHFDHAIIALCVRWYITYKLSYRALLEMMAAINDAYALMMNASKDENAA